MLNKYKNKVCEDIINIFIYSFIIPSLIVFALICYEDDINFSCFTNEDNIFIMLLIVFFAMYNIFTRICIYYNENNFIVTKGISSSIPEEYSFKSIVKLNNYSYRIDLHMQNGEVIIMSKLFCNKLKLQKFIQACS